MVRTSSSQSSQISGRFTQVSQFWSYTFIKHPALPASQPERPPVSQTQPKAWFYPAHPLCCSWFRGKSIQLLVCSAKHSYCLQIFVVDGKHHQGKCQPISCPQHRTWTSWRNKMCSLIPSLSQPSQWQCHQGALPTIINTDQKGKPKSVWFTFLNVLKLSEDWGLHIRILYSSQAGKSWPHFPWDLHVLTIKIV